MIKTYKEENKRCFGGQPGKEFYAEYHDHEWGIPVHNDKHLFELLVLEGAGVHAHQLKESHLQPNENYRNSEITEREERTHQPQRVGISPPDETIAKVHIPTPG